MIQSMHRARPLVRALWLLPLFALAGCDELPLGGCPGWERHGIEIEVRDARTGVPAAHGATGWVKDGSYTDVLQVSGWTGSPPDPSNALVLSGAMERRGRYDVVVRKAGYQEWRRSGVRVGGNSCGVEPVRLRAELVPLTGSSLPS